MSKPLNTPEPPPQRRDDRPKVWDLVIADMRARDCTGSAKYGTPLQPDNGRDAMRDAYQEVLDLAVYLRQFIHETAALARPLSDPDFRAALAALPAEEAEAWSDLPDAVAVADYIELARNLGECPAAHALVDAAERIGLRRDAVMERQRHS